MAAALRSTAGLALRPASRLFPTPPTNSRARTMFTEGPHGSADGGWPDIIFSFVALTGSCIFAWIAFDGDGPDGCIRGRGGGGRRGR
ncbi:hypothetical protein ZWY2020_012664 [Hordeum vulgare]|nr:hypothetical protein ZWY2020_012664 [Hordeum vulgare]